MLIACTRAVSPSLARCELTHLAREPIDVARAHVEHAAYEHLLTRLGATVQRLPPQPDLPDAVFVEDTAVVLDEVAVIALPGAPSRRPETRSVEIALAAHRPIVRLQSPATLEGGDVLVSGRRVFVGLSSRTNVDAIRQMTVALQPLDYEVLAVGFTGCLHLKSAATLVGENLLLLNPAWVNVAAFAGHGAINVDPGEPQAGNALRIEDTLIHPSHFPATRDRLETAGLHIAPVALSELAKAEAGVTCCSLLLRVD